MGGRKVSSPQWIEFHMTRTRDLKSADTDLFRIVTGGNLGISRDFYDYLGGSDESFTQWGAEDTELGYRAFNAGGVLVPERGVLPDQERQHEPVLLAIFGDVPDAERAPRLGRAPARRSPRGRARATGRTPAPSASHNCRRAIPW